MVIALFVLLQNLAFPEVVIGEHPKTFLFHKYSVFPEFYIF